MQTDLIYGLERNDRNVKCEVAVQGWAGAPVSRHKSADRHIKLNF